MSRFNKYFYVQKNTVYTLSITLPFDPSISKVDSINNSFPKTRWRIKRLPDSEAFRSGSAQVKTRRRERQGMHEEASGLFAIWFLYGTMINIEINKSEQSIISSFMNGASALSGVRTPIKKYTSSNVFPWLRLHSSTA